MNKVFSFVIGAMFAVVVLCFSITPVVNAAMVGDGEAHPGNIHHQSAHHQSEDSSPKSCQHDVKTQAQFQQHAQPLQVTGLDQALFLTSFFPVQLQLQSAAQGDLSSLRAHALSGSPGLHELREVKTVVLRF